MPDQALRVLLVEGRPEPARALIRDLEALEFMVAGVAGDGARACQLCAGLAPDLVLMAIDLPGGDGIQAARALLRQTPLPVVLLTDRADRGLLDRAQRAGVQSYLLKPVEAAVLGPALALAHHNFHRESRLACEVADLREGLRRRKLLERAKGLIMARLRVGEAEAQARLEVLSRDQGNSLHQAAEAVVEAHNLLHRPRQRNQSPKR